MKLVLLVAAVLALAAPAAVAVNKPRVWMTSQKPLVVHGAGLAKGDKVAVSVTKGKLVLRKRSAAGSRGRFVAKFARALPGTCKSTIVRAAASSGRKAIYFGAPPLGCKRASTKG